METMIFLLVGFLVVVYVYSFIKIRKKRRSANKSEVLEFNKKYHSQMSAHYKQQPATTDSNYKKYITKYNSSVDYISKDEL